MYFQKLKNNLYVSKNCDYYRNISASAQGKEGDSWLNNTVMQEYNAGMMYSILSIV